MHYDLDVIAPLQCYVMLRLLSHLLGTISRFPTATAVDTTTHTEYQNTAYDTHCDDQYFEVDWTKKEEGKKIKKYMFSHKVLFALLVLILNGTWRTRLGVHHH